MEDLDATFITRVKKGDIMAAGSNFGCGSSREHAPLAIKESGIGAVVAKSFARIFYRNAINIGLPIIECGADIKEGDKVEIDFDKGELKNLTQNTVTEFAPFPSFLQNIIAAGGLLNSINAGGGGAK
jgi:3-isopropylmalate/(R)-2-methylmalate dehydratase small subunit